MKTGTAAVERGKLLCRHVLGSRLWLPAIREEGFTNIPDWPHAAERNNPARTRTWKNRTKICCVTDYTTGFWKLSLVVAESESDFSQFLADFVK